MDSALDRGLRVKHLLKVGLVCGLLSIAAGIVVTALRLTSLGQLTELPGFSWPMLAPLLLGGAAVVISMIAILKQQPLKEAATLFGIGLLGMVTPFVIGLVILALLIALILAVVAQS